MKQSIPWCKEDLWRTETLPVLSQVCDSQLIKCPSPEGLHQIEVGKLVEVHKSMQHCQVQLFPGERNKVTHQKGSGKGEARPMDDCASSCVRVGETLALPQAEFGSGDITLLEDLGNPALLDL
jgi:hypothetical protein